MNRKNGFLKRTKLREKSDEEWRICYPHSVSFAAGFERRCEGSISANHCQYIQRSLNTFFTLTSHNFPEKNGVQLIL